MPPNAVNAAADVASNATEAPGSMNCKRWWSATQITGAIDIDIDIDIDNSKNAPRPTL
jgi:hypothetical protein